jgi:glycosyltransferase involved in cell wall biosynthesis
MACGVPLLVSDLPVLREVAGDAALYAPVGDVPAWTQAALRLLEERRTSAESWRLRRAAGRDRVRLFRWPTHVAHLVEMYRELHERGRVQSKSA